MVRLRLIRQWWPRRLVGSRFAEERSLSAILVADVVGYSGLMGADELGTLRALRHYRSNVIDPVIAAWNGRLVKSTGDGILAEFGSAIEAVSCAVLLQRSITAQQVLTEKQLAYRIGINVGDIIRESDDIFGDGVNIAARLEALCEPGGICVSRAVRDQVRDKLSVAFDDMGELPLKNIVRPVRVFSITPRAIAAASGLVERTRAAPPRAGIWTIGIVSIGALLIAGSWLLVSFVRSGRPVPSTTPIMSSDNKKASIAVLPLSSLNAETADDYFADGLTEDIISSLGRFRDLSVSARGATFAYKGRNPRPEDVARDLRARYVVDGSVRRDSQRVRVSVSLMDASRGTLLWSQKYDAELKDLFAVQDQITRSISGALAVRVSNLEAVASAAKQTSNLEAYDLVLQGRNRLNRLTRANNAEARVLFNRAIDLDPTYAPAYVGLGRVDRFAAVQGWTQSPSTSLETSESLARKAIELDALNPGAHALLGQVLVQFGDYDRALDVLRRAVELNPSDVESYSGLASVLLWRGDTQNAISAGETIMQFQPELPAPEAFHLATAYVLAARGAEAIRILQQSIGRNATEPNTNVMLVAAYTVEGRQADAENQAKLVRQRFPWFSVDEFGSLLRDEGQRGKLRLALKKAGL